MKKNMGSGDKITRIIIAAVIAVLFFTHVITGTLAIVLGILALVFVLTSLINFCPIYAVLGMNTCPKKQ